MGLCPLAPLGRDQTRRRAEGEAAVRCRRGCGRARPLRTPDRTWQGRAAAGAASRGQAGSPAARVKVPAGCRPGCASSVGFPLMPARPDSSASRQARPERAGARKKSKRGRPKTGSVETWTRKNSDVGFGVRFFDQYGIRRASRARAGRTGEQRSSSRTSSGSSRPGRTGQRPMPSRARTATRSSARSPVPSSPSTRSRRRPTRGISTRTCSSITSRRSSTGCGSRRSRGRRSTTTRSNG